jgi:hypothetical protein
VCVCVCVYWRNGKYGNEQYVSIWSLCKGRFTRPPLADSSNLFLSREAYRKRIRVCLSVPLKNSDAMSLEGLRPPMCQHVTIKILPPVLDDRSVCISTK